MASIVGGFCMPHDPLITGATEAADPEQAGNIFAAFAAVRRAVAARQADTVVLIGDDHYAMFGPHCLPSLLIAIGDLEGPIEPWLRIPRRPVPNNTALAEHIMAFGFERGFDWAVAKTLSLDHATMVPTHLAIPDGVRVIPIYLAAGVAPLIRPERCYQLGRMLGDAIGAWRGDERVAIFGTGGISHWVGTKQMGAINIEFDRKVLRLVEAGDVRALVGLDDDYVERDGGNGAWEIRNWIVAMAALPGCKGRVLAYEPIPPWITGLGLAELVA